MTTITGSLKDSTKVGTARGTVTFTPMNTHEVRTGPDDAYLGPIQKSINEVTDYVIDPGAWVIEIQPSYPMAGAGGRREFTPIRLEVELSADISWADLLEGLAQTPELTPSLVTQAQEAAAEAEMYAAQTEQLQDTAVESLVTTDGTATKQALTATFAGRAQTLTGDHEPGVQIIQSSALDEFQYGIYLADNANNKGRLLKMNHFGGQAQAAGAAYALDIQNYPGSGAALVLHQYSDYQSALILDNTDSRAAILMRNTQNDAINPGNWGTGDYVQLDGYEKGAEGGGAGTVHKIGTLDQNLVLTSFDQSKPWTFKASGHVNHALYIDASHAGKGLHIDGTGTTSASNSISVNHGAPSHAVTITATDGIGNFSCLNLSGKNFGALIQSSGSLLAGYALMVRKNDTGLGRALVVHNKGASNSIEVENASSTVLFSITAAGLPRWQAAVNVQTTVGAAGAASALPATPSKYLKVVGDDGTTYVVPAYAAS